MYIYLVLSVSVKDLHVYCLFKSEYYFKPRTIILNYYHQTCLANNASINVKPGGRGNWAYVGHLISIAFPTLRNLTKNLGPRVGMFAFFFVQRNRAKAHHPMCLSECSAVIKALKDRCF